MNKQPVKFFVIVLLLGWSFDFLFWKKSIGVNFPIFASLCIIGGFFLLQSNGIRPARNSLWLLVPFVFFAVITFTRQEPLTTFLAYTISIVSMGMLATTYLGGRWVEYSLSDYFVQFFQLFGSTISLPTDFIKQVCEELAEKDEPAKKIPFIPLLRGLGFALPIVVCFGTLLASADLVFKQKITEFFEHFKAGLFAEYFFRIIIILFCAHVLTGVFLHAASKSNNEKLIGEEKPVITPFMGFIETTVILGSVAFLFTLFVIVQFQYFFGGNANIGIAGYTYSEYARRGFNELITVAFFSLLLILGLSTITKRESEKQRRVYSGLSVAIVALVMVILVSAYQRLSLGIDWHGYSRFRLYPSIFLIWVGILFIAVVVLEIFRRERYFAFAALLASLGFAASLSLFNIDASIVTHNVLRATQGRHFNVYYLTSLSADAVPPLVNEFMNNSLSAEIHEGIGAALLCHLYSNTEFTNLNNDWRSFNISRRRANNAINEVELLLQNYHINEKKNPIRVITPNDVTYECAK